MTINPAKPPKRPDVEGIADRAEQLRLDVLALRAYIGQLEEELHCPLGFDSGSEDCSAGTCPKCLSVRLKASIEKLEAVMRADNDYRISPGDCTAALGDGDG